MTQAKMEEDIILSNIFLMFPHEQHKKSNRTNSITGKIIIQEWQLNQIYIFGNVVIILQNIVAGIPSLFIETDDQLEQHLFEYFL